MIPKVLSAAVIAGHQKKSTTLLEAFVRKRASDLADKLVGRRERLFIGDSVSFVGRFIGFAETYKHEGWCSLFQIRVSEDRAAAGSISRAEHAEIIEESEPSMMQAKRPGSSVLPLFDRLQK